MSLIKIKTVQKVKTSSLHLNEGDFASNSFSLQLYFGITLHITKCNRYVYITGLWI